MTRERSLAREIYDWRRMPAPTERFRRGHRNATAYDLEMVIDHMTSHVDSLLRGWEEGADRDDAALLQSRIGEVETARQLLAETALSTSERAPYAACLEATDALLRRLASTRAGAGEARLV